MKLSSLSLLMLALSAGSVQAANLDVTSAYRMLGVSYKNLDLGSNAPQKSDHSFISNDARLGLAVRKIALGSGEGEDMTMDVGVLLHALGASGSTNTLTAPFDRIAANYPNANFTPFIENAYLRVHELFGLPLEATFGRQSYRLGSGLLLDDDGAGFTGVSARAELPWWGLKVEGFAFGDSNPRNSNPNTLGLFGFSLDLPTEGTWQINELIERDHEDALVYGCTYDGAPSNSGCTVSKAVRSFSSARYQLNYGPMVFDGEAAIEKGAATPTGLTPAPTHITYNGNAEVIRAKWKQPLYKVGEGIAHIVLARGSGDNTATKGIDEAFFPSHGHQFNGLERSGFGDFFGATPYNAFGGNYSSTTANGLQQGVSGITVVGLGYTTPAYKNANIDVDYYLFQADRVTTGSRSLGSEWDIHLNYAIRDRFKLTVGTALFKAGQATDLNKSTARRYSLEASGRF